jgi:hypothetical protein
VLSQCACCVSFVLYAFELYDLSDPSENEIAQIRKEDGIVFEDLLEKLKRNRDELSSVEVVILVEMYRMLEKALDIDRHHLEEYLRKRIKDGDGCLLRYSKCDV